MRGWLIAVFMLLGLQQANAYTVVISEAELQSKVMAMMPMEKTKFFVTVTLSNPDIDLSLGEHKLGLFSDIKLSAPGGIKGTGSLKIIGALEYHADEGAFYFKDPQIVSLESQNISAKMLPKVTELAQLAVQEFMSSEPVYRLRDDDLKQQFAKSMLQSVTVEKGKLIIELGLF